MKRIQFNDSATIITTTDTGHDDRFITDDESLDQDPLHNSSPGPTHVARGETRGIQYYHGHFKQNATAPLPHDATHVN